MYSSPVSPKVKKLIFDFLETSRNGLKSISKPLKIQFSIASWSVKSQKKIACGGLFAKATQKSCCKPIVLGSTDLVGNNVWCFPTGLKTLRFCSQRCFALYLAYLYPPKGAQKNSACGGLFLNVNLFSTVPKVHFFRACSGPTFRVLRLPRCVL